MPRKKLGSIKSTDEVVQTNVDLATADVTGVLPTARGGTETGAPVLGDLLRGIAGNLWSRLAKGSNGQFLRVKTDGTDLEWTAPPAGGAVSSPFTGEQAPGDFTVADGQFALHGKRLKLTGSQRGTIAGSARLIISG